MTEPSDSSADLAALEKQQRDGITRWVKEELGGAVSKILRLPRWRPVWRVDYQKNGADHTLLVKGTRPSEATPYSIEHEVRLNQILEANGIGVPHAYGLMDFPRAAVMDWAEGTRDPGLVVPSIENPSTMNPERWQAALKYMDVLAEIHSIPVEAFADTEATLPTTSDEIALAYFDRNHQLLAERDRVDALVEFFTSWLRRNVPRHRTQKSFVTGDCGQFLNRGEEITAILDLEIGHIGDPMHDLACFRGRQGVENMGDIPSLYRRYEKASGEPLDIPVIAYHTVTFLAAATIQPTHLAILDKHKGGDWVEGIMLLAFIARRTLEAIAEIAGVALDDPQDIELPKAQISPHRELAMDKLEQEIANLPTSETFPDWQRDVLITLPQYLRHEAQFGRWMESENLREIGEAIHDASIDFVDSDRALKAYVQRAEPEEDAKLIRLFHRQYIRLCKVLAGPDAPKDHLLFLKIEPILHMMSSSDT